MPLQGTLCAYDYGTWDLSWPDHPRWSINFFAFNSSDTLDSSSLGSPSSEVCRFMRLLLHVQCRP